MDEGSALAEEPRKPSAAGRFPFGNRSIGKSRGPAIAIEIEGRSVWVAEAAMRGGKPVIVRVAHGELPEQTEEVPKPAGTGAKALGQLLSTLKFRVGAAILVVPSGKQILRNLSVPASPDLRETASMVRFQAAKDLPFAGEEIVVDFLVRTAPASAATGMAPNIFAAALRKESVDESLALAQSAGFKLRGLGLRSIGAAQWGAQYLSDAEAREPIALITLGEGFVHTDVMKGRDLLFTRSTKVPRDSDPAIRAKSVSIECVRALSGFSGASLSRGISRVVVTGGTGLETEVAGALRARLSLSCEALDPGEHMGLKPEFREAARGGIGAMGLALAAMDDEGLRIDLLHPKKPSEHRDLRRLRLLVGIALAAAAFLMLVAIRMSMVKTRTAILKQVELEIAEGEKKRPVYRAMKQQSATLLEWTRGRKDWLDHYAYLSAVLPPSEDVYLTSLAISGPSSIRLSVQARGGEILSRLEKQLRAAGYEVKPMAINPGSDRFGYDFRTTVELVVPEKLKVNLAGAKPPARLADDISLEPGSMKGARP